MTMLLKLRALSSRWRALPVLSPGRSGAAAGRSGYTKTLFMVFICAGAINMCQFFVHNIWQYAAVTFIYGLFLAGAVPNINARLVEVTDPSVRGKAFGLVTSAQQFGGVVGFWAAF